MRTTSLDSKHLSMRLCNALNSNERHSYERPTSHDPEPCSLPSEIYKKKKMVIKNIYLSFKIFFIDKRLKLSIRLTVISITFEG